MKLYTNVSFIFAIWAVVILTIFFFGFSSLPHSNRFSSDFFRNFSNWDGGHYLGIAQFGYQESFQYAFFPLYPLIIKILNQITNNYLLSAILISWLSVFFGMQLLYKLLSLDFDKKLAEKVILALIFFPTSFYFLTAYSESLFFLLVVATFYFLRSNKIFLAVLITALASATRVWGLALVLALIIGIQSTTGINRKNWFVLLSPLGFLAYCLFLYNQTGDPFYFITAQKHWQRELSIPLFSFWDTLKSLTTPGFISSNFNQFLDLLFAVFGLGLALRSFRFLPVFYSTYAFVSIVIPLFTPTLSSIPRFLLPVFPIFILVGLTKNRFLGLAYQIISLMLLGLFSALFINGYWVA